MSAVSRLIIRELGLRGLAMARRYLDNRQGSKTLSDDMAFQQVDDTEGVIYVPHYWAHYVHDGRAGKTMPPGRYMVYFPDARDDPRTSGGTRYPTRYHQVRARRLTTAEFQEFQKINKDRAAAGAPPIMVVASRVGPVTKKIPFFDVGLKGLLQVARDEVPAHLRVEIYKRRLGRVQNLGAGTMKIG